MISLALLRRFWPIPAALAIIVAAWLYIGHVDHVARAEQIEIDRAIINGMAADIRDKTAQAKENDLAHARDIEATRDKIRQEVSGEYAKDLASARATAAAYVVRTKVAQAAAGGGGATAMSGPPGSTVRTSDDRDAVISVADLEICTSNTVKAKAWVAWWEKIEGAPQ